eukprot:251397-Chlamydomonas_euryale.AAC.1
MAVGLGERFVRHWRMRWTFCASLVDGVKGRRSWAVLGGRVPHVEMDGAAEWMARLDEWRGWAGLCGGCVPHLESTPGREFAACGKARQL